MSFTCTTNSGYNEHNYIQSQDVRNNRVYDYKDLYKNSSWRVNIMIVRYQTISVLLQTKSLTCQFFMSISNVVGAFSCPSVVLSRLQVTF